MVKHSHVLVNCLEFQSRTELYYVVLCCTVVALHFTGMYCVCYCTVLLHHYHVDGYVGYVCFIKGLSLILYNKEIAFLVSNFIVHYHVFCCSDLYSIKFYCILFQDRMVTNTAVTNEMMNTEARNKYVAYDSITTEHAPSRGQGYMPHTLQRIFAKCFRKHELHNHAC